jgi:predicted secreted hydrolase
MKILETNFTKQNFRCVCALLLSLAFFSRASATEIPASTADGYAIPQAGKQFSFPRDHGSHPDFAIEWWYITGHLFATNEAQFGFQATFFRRALVPPGATNSPSSTAFGNDQIYLAHMALVDKTSGKFIYEEKLNRAGWDAASATNTLDVHNGNWSLRLIPKKTSGSEIFELHGTVGAEAAFVMNLSPKKPMVIFGANGVSRKAADANAASHYLTYPRLATEGTLKLAEKKIAVTGEAWMDHEFSSSQLGAGQVGWDWLSLQLFDGREIMAYRMRRADGSTDPFSTVAWVDAQSVVRHIGPDKFSWSTLERWHSVKSNSDYPSLVELTAQNPMTGKPEKFTVRPFAADQELLGKIGGTGYWEGACRVLDENKKEIGRAYLELTGYSESLKGKF